MSVTKKDAQYIANLAKLKYSDEELENFTHQMNEILAYIDKLNELNTDGVEPLSHPVENTNVFRHDEKKKSIERDNALKNAPDSNEEYFKVPKVINQ